MGFRYTRGSREPSEPVSESSTVKDQPSFEMGSAGSVSAAILLSRILGLVRDMVQSRWFGAGLQTDAWTIAYRIPNLLRDLSPRGR